MKSKLNLDGKMVFESPSDGLYYCLNKTQIKLLANMQGSINPNGDKRGFATNKRQVTAAKQLQMLGFATVCNILGEDYCEIIPYIPQTFMGSKESVEKQEEEYFNMVGGR